MNKENCALKLVDEIILDVMKLIIAVRNCVNAPKKETDYG